MLNRDRKFFALIIVVLTCVTRVHGADEEPPSSQDSLQRAAELLAEDRADGALQALKDLEAVEPKNPWLWFLRGRAHAKLGEPHEAMECFDRALDELAASPTSDEALAERIRSERRASRRQVHSLSLRAGFAFDSNVTFSGGGVSLISGERDYKGFTGLNWDFAPLVTRQEAIVVGLRMAHTWYTDIHEFDDQGYGAYARYSRRLADPWRVDFQYDYDLTLLGRDGFLSSNALLSRLAYVWPAPPRTSIPSRGRLLETSLEYRVEARDFLYSTREEFDRDGITNSFGIEQSARFRPIAGIDWDWDVFAGYRFTYVPTEGSEFDCYTHDFSLAMVFPVNNLFVSKLPAAVRFSAEWELDDYQNPSFYDAQRRERRDLLTTLGLIYSQTLVDTDKDGELILHGILQWTDADSNVRDRELGEPFTYEKMVAGLQLEWRF